MSASNAFTCAACGATFEKAWTDEEANAEADELWGDDLGDEPATVCEDCFQAMTAEKPIAEYLAETKGRESDRSE